MLTLRLFLVILVTLLCREICWQSETHIEWMRALLGVLAVSVSFGAVAKVLCILNLRKFGACIECLQYGSQDQSFDRWQSVRQSLETFWVLCLPATLMLTNWGPWIKQLDELGMLQSISLVLWFVPSLTALIILELTTSQMEVFIENWKFRSVGQMQFVVTPKYQGIERRAHLIQVLDASGIASRVPAKLSKILGTRIRLGGTSNVMACLLPVLLIASASDLLKILQVDWPESLQSLIASVFGLGVVAIFMPQWLSRWMGVRKLKPGLLRDRIQTYGKAVGVRVEPMWVASDGRWAGAAVVGWLAGFRQLWLGDALVEQLSVEEVDMVVMHELAHLKRRHFLWRLLPVVAACAIGLVTVSIFSSTSSYSPSDRYIQISGQVIGMALASGAMLFGISYWSRLCELDADWTACQLAATVCPWAGGDARIAAVVLSRSLTKLHRDSATHDQATWLHPALGQRLARLVTKREAEDRGEDSLPKNEEVSTAVAPDAAKKRVDLVSRQISLEAASD